jgi:hypothetical protein
MTEVADARWKCALMAGLTLSFALACRDGERKPVGHDAGGDRARPGAVVSGTTPPGKASAAAPGSAAKLDAAPLPPARTEGCPDGMVRVEGDYCPAVVQECLEHHKEYADNKGTPSVSERCIRYREPSRCVSKRLESLAFCMDRFEYPNELGQMPRVLTSWLQAKALCEQKGKRLCTEDEFNLACEGPDLRPYVYGFVRNDELCNIDREYRYPDHSRRMATYDECQKSESCRAELQRLDQRHAIGSRLTCVSWAGVVDLNGNVNEWVERRGNKPPPHRSGLKGGWWGPVRNRCRPTVEFHKEHDYGYEAGFRCCADSSG